MANDEHVALLKRSVDAWNKWRLESPQVRVDLSEADLIKAKLFGAPQTRLSEGAHMAVRLCASRRSQTVQS
jgi:hypothetical protein